MSAQYLDDVSNIMSNFNTNMEKILSMSLDELIKRAENRGAIPAWALKLAKPDSQLKPLGQTLSKKSAYLNRTKKTSSVAPAAGGRRRRRSRRNRRKSK